MEGAIVRIEPVAVAMRDVDRTVAEVAAANGGHYTIDAHLRHDPGAASRRQPWSAAARRLPRLLARPCSRLIAISPTGSAWCRSGILQDRQERFGGILHARDPYLGQICLIDAMTLRSPDPVSRYPRWTMCSALSKNSCIWCIAFANAIRVSGG
nr:DUF3363 domain-containing protein [Novosphingobium sp. Gsoil 351]